MKISKFQIITLGLFIIFIAAGVTAFALYKGGNNSATALPPITVWGTFPASTFNQYVSKINNGLQQTIVVKYVQKTPESFSSEFVSNLARGTGPDAILIPSDMILPQEDKLALVPYSALSQRAFMDSYIEEAQIYLSDNGILALPFMVDPLVMYWNRDMFSGAGIATYPRSWSEFGDLAKKLTIKDENENIRKSFTAMGDFNNVGNARELLGALFLQLGNPVTTTNNSGVVVSTVKVSAAANPGPALQFFTQFVDPSNAAYSWNRGMPDSKSAFLSGMLATYFGFASELRDLRAKNPNLNFDAAPLPQAKTGGVKATYGRMTGFSLVRASSNLDAAFQIISLLTAPQYLGDLSQSLYLPSVRTDLIAQGSNDPYISIFNYGALISATWLDADPAISRQIFGNMVESITSGHKSLSQSIQDAGAEYDLALRRAMQ